MSIAATIEVVVLYLEDCGLISVPWELSSQSLAGLCFGTKPVWLKVHSCQVLFCHLSLSFLSSYLTVVYFDQQIFCSCALDVLLVRMTKKILFYDFQMIFIVFVHVNACVRWSKYTTFDVMSQGELTTISLFRCPKLRSPLYTNDFLKILFSFQMYRTGISQVIPENFDSRKVFAEGSPDHSAIHVIKNPRQILPYCVIITQVLFPGFEKA